MKLGHVKDICSGSPVQDIQVHCLSFAIALTVLESLMVSRVVACFGFVDSGAGTFYIFFLFVEDKKNEISLASSLSD